VTVLRIAVGGEPVEREWRDPRSGIVWRYRVRPVLQRESLTVAHELGLGSLEELSRPTAAAALHYQEVARRALIEFVSVSANGGEVRMEDGRAATDPELRGRLLDAQPALAAAVADEALGAGFRVEEERGNLSGVPG
jgi:hypothetical protein